VLEEAEAVEPLISSRELHKRRDFRQLPIVTIDGETARDFDDAVTVHRLKYGNFELSGAHCRRGPLRRAHLRLDQEARLRGTSVYFPIAPCPCFRWSFQPTFAACVRRLSVCDVLHHGIDHQGEIVRYELCPGVIRSAERMTYTGVNAVLEGDAGMRKRYADLTGVFELMRDLGDDPESQA